MAKYRQKRFKRHPAEGNISKGIEIDGHHIYPQKNGGSDEPENITMIPKGFHQAFNCGNKRKNQDIVANVKSGMAEVMIKNSKTLDKIKN